MTDQLASFSKTSFRILIGLTSIFFLQGCWENPKTQQMPSANALPPAVPSTKKEVPKPVQHALMEFIGYEDDGDYFQFIALKGDSVLHFVNSEVKERNLNRGDLIQVSWKEGTITMAGDDEAEVPADLLIAVDKIRDGSVSLFRKSYAKDIHFTFSPEQNYSDGYNDKIYLIVEYYLSTTQNKLLKHLIRERAEISYSIEEQNRGGRAYIVIGISGGQNLASPVQWLYIDNENYQLYEYDLPNDELKAYR